MSIKDYPDTTWATDVCKIGHGHTCCRFLTMHPDGWSCEKHSPLADLLTQRALAGEMNARGDNCPGKDSR
jgi:hypothetical protein